MTISGPVSVSDGTHHWYNFTILDLNETVLPADIGLEARTPVGDILDPFPWNVTFVHAGSIQPFAVYNASIQGWNPGSTAKLVRGDVLSVAVGTSEVAGDVLALLGQGDLAGVLEFVLN